MAALEIKTARGEVATVGTFDMDVRLPADQKGTHMSRFVALLEDNRDPLDLAAFRVLLDGLMENRAVSMEYESPYRAGKSAASAGAAPRAARPPGVRS
mgnify:CR=1 FL=1